MAYTLDFSLAPGEPFYLEIVLFDLATGGAIGTTNVDHQFSIFARGCDYGEEARYGQVIASTLNGKITQPLPSVLAIYLPPTAFNILGPWQLSERSLRYEIKAVPADPTFTMPLIEGSITFGGH